MFVISTCDRLSPSSFSLDAILDMHDRQDPGDEAQLKFNGENGRLCQLFQFGTEITIPFANLFYSVRDKRK